ncbi:HPF/RaiA family ribosome-associated protein [Rhodovibrio salinarum]|nr:HPF/RaiA family ribosome-associated protein [Rhodovibrio salinarum]
MAVNDADLRIPVDITFHGMESSDHLRHQVLKQAQKLDRFHKHITNVRVVLDADHKQVDKSTLHCKVEVSIPGTDTLVAQKEDRPHEAVNHADQYSVINEAFEVAGRRVNAYIDKHFDHQHKQPHPAAGQARGTITRVDSERRHGMLETHAGQSLFFQDTAVKGETLDDLEPGMEVSYALAEAEGAYGPEAKEITRVIGGKTD